MSQQSVFFVISKQAFGIVFAKLYWCKCLTKKKQVPNWWKTWMTPEIYIFHLRTDGLYLPNLIIHELPVAHSKTSIWWHFVIVYADTLVVKAPHQK